MPKRYGFMKDLEVLYKGGYEVKDFGNYHYRITKKGSAMCVDIWPTTGKFMEVGTSVVGHYDDIAEAMLSMFSEEIND